MNKLLSIVLVCSMLFPSVDAASAGKSIFRKKVKKEAVVAKPTPKPSPTKGPKPYSEVITSKAKTSSGFMKVHQVDQNYFFEIPDSILQQDLLVVGRIAKAPVMAQRAFVGYAGDYIGENVIRFELGKDDRVLLRTISYTERASDSTGMYLSVLNSNVQSIMGMFEVKAYRKDTVSGKQSVVIDVTDFIKSENTVLYFDDRVKKALSIGNQLNDRSYIDGVKAFPKSVEIRSVKTFTNRPANPNARVADPSTFELNSSVILLPRVPMKPRYYDPRVGYFTTRYTDYDKNPQGIERVAMITRWRLEPKEEDLEKYLAGELVEPEKPIVYYIDPTTPKKWVPYLIQGVNDWQKAFEKAGFKNAIYALEAPDDSTWTIESALHSAIVYKPSSVPNASGPHVHDPRSGEILESHINWYHNVMSLLHHWYFIQAGPYDPRARSMKYDDELMGRLIRFVSSHEVGHTLGLRHNFGASATVPVEKLRDRNWLSENHHTPSMMDYARFNYVAQPEDSVPERGIIPEIGMYDEWSIQWGYSYLPRFETAADEVPYMQEWVTRKLKEDPRYAFGTETDPNDPRNQNEDLGDNAMKAGTYGIKNLQRIIPELLDWTREPNKDYENARVMYNEVVGQFNRYMGHVAKNVAGIYTTPKMVEEQGLVTEHVPASIQKEAMYFLNKQLFTTPMWLSNRELVGKAGVDPVASIAAVQRNILNRLISRATFDKLIMNESLNGKDAYTAMQLMADLKKAVFTEMNTGRPVDVYRRNLQKNYVNALMTVLNGTLANSTATPVDRTAVVLSDATAIARAHLATLRTDLIGASLTSTGLTRAHFQDLAAVIEEVLQLRN